ncbi:MAG: hypothetical protein ACFFAO_20360 [Candidatus Hermodarchaeota archaeon]
MKVNLKPKSNEIKMKAVSPIKNKKKQNIVEEFLSLILSTPKLGEK